SIGVPYVLSRRVLEIPRLALNVHNGLLPKYRGHFATFWEVLEREPRYGVTVHRMAAKVDAGAIVAQQTLGWDEATSFADLLIRKKRIGGALLARAVRDAFDQNAPTPDKPMTPHYGFPKIADLRRWSWKNRAPNR
ncbi:MAG TPA: formyltransferase family protein, partial [Rhizomicrobium sp.]|nr:formyltransferase family protein [Rhizomicrobium sp.]